MAYMVYLVELVSMLLAIEPVMMSLPKVKAPSSIIPLQLLTLIYTDPVMVLGLNWSGR